MAKRNGPSGGSPQPWQVAASATNPPGSKTKAPVAPVGSDTGGARPASDRPDFAPTPPSAPPAAPTIPTDPKGFQQYLKAHGANLGRSGPNKDGVDGIIGPRTVAEAQRLNIPIPANLYTPPPAAPAPTVPPPAPTTGTTPSVNTAPAQSQAVTNPTASMDDATLATYFGYGTWVLQVPELKAIIDRYATSQQSGTPMTADELRTAVEGSQYWKTHDAAQRQYDKDVANGEAQPKIDAQKTAIAQQAQVEGVTLDPARLDQMATDAVRNGWTTAQLDAAIAAEFRYQPGAQTGTIGRQELGIKALAGDYLVPVSDSTLNQWDTQIAQSGGRLTSENFRQYFVDQAKSLFPQMSAQLDQGLTTQQLVDPYRQLAAKELDITPDSIDFTQPKWLGLISSVADPKTGVMTMPGLAQAQQKIRSDPTYGWDSTTNGKTAYAQMGVALTQALGLRA